LRENGARQATPPTGFLRFRRRNGFGTADPIIDVTCRGGGVGGSQVRVPGTEAFVVGVQVGVVCLQAEDPGDAGEVDSPAIRVPIRRSRAISVSLYRRTPPPVRAIPASSAATVTLYTPVLPSLAAPGVCGGCVAGIVSTPLALCQRAC
jgi:hypothetical protein